ncbi:hypothetical protein PRNP1_004891 [Phytophthora ramorum]
MVSSTSFFAAAAVVAMSADYVQAHGYMEKPLAEFKEGTESPSAWVVELEPQWKGNWDEAKGDEGLVALYKELKASNNIKDIRTMIDSDTKLYGADCGFTDPKATPKDPPSTGDATFSRGMVHAGPCERRDSKTWWQVYKNCVPLSGPAGGGASQTSPSSGASDSPSSGASDSPSSGTSDSPSSGTSDSPSSGTSDSPSSGASDSPSSGTSDSPSSGTSDSPSSGASDSPSSGSSESSETTPAPETPSVETPASGKCSIRRARH